ncbi:MAG: hypothetical protein QOD77_27 [Thermoplasmata archaeon]|jgi:nucleoside-diphosphate-sugar epimerase|nr:hypothetical protein [Thermoplasmata archaeon]
MHVLVTGGAGYIGTVMTDLLLAQGHEVTVLDRFFFGDTLADLQAHPRLRLVRADVRKVEPSHFAGVHAVLDLAALSNDPAGELDPQKTLQINHEGRARVARKAKEAGVGRYVVATSCSIYGFQDDVVDETSKSNPLTTYAEANGLVEQSNLPLASGDFCVTALRQATVYGASRRMRFDLAVNAMALAIHKTGGLKLMRDGTQWRPFVHVRDTCRAFIQVLGTPEKKVNGEIFNVGSAAQNVQLQQLAEQVAKGCGVPLKFDWYGDGDHRSYRVSFDKIERVLGYRTEWTPETGAREIALQLRSGRLADAPPTRTVEWYKHLIATQPQELAADGPIL